MSQHNRFDHHWHHDNHHHDRHHFDQFFFNFEHFGHGHQDHLPPTLLDATVADNATDGNGHILNGGGNPADGWEIQNSGDFQLAADVHYRQGDTVQPVAATDDGLLVYSMPGGAQVQDSQHGVPSDNPNRAAASFDWSFDTGTHQTIQQFLASGGQFIVKIDLNPGQNNDPLTLHAVYDPAHSTGTSGVVWEDSHNNILIADDGGNAYVTQNSQNYAFYQSLIDIDPHTHGIQTGPVGPDGIFDIEEQIIAPHHDVVADVHSVLQIGDATLDTGHDLPVTLLDATVADNATDGSGHILSGSGNPADGWEIQNNHDFQLATDVHYRQGDTVQPSAVSDDGALIYNMPAGPQVADPAHNVPGANANRAATSFDFSFDTGVGTGPHQTIQQFLASGGQFIFKIDLDPGQQNDPLTLHAVYDPTTNTGGSHVVWEDAHNHVVIGDDAGNDYVTQNSQNYAFYQSLIDVDPHTHGTQTGPVGPAGTFDIEEQIIAPHHDMIADIHSILVLT
jgi:hypothetical protein